MEQMDNLHLCKISIEIPPFKKKSEYYLFRIK
jgi:hypothetical protein